MSVNIPQPFVSVLQVAQPFRTKLEGVPTDFNVGVDALPVVHLALDSLPTIHLSVDSIPKIQLGVDPVEIRLTEFPSIRGHLPADFAVCFSLLGFDLATVRLCGEAQIITEPYVPNPCEICDDPKRVAIAVGDDVLTGAGARQSQG